MAKKPTPKPAANKAHAKKAAQAKAHTPSAPPKPTVSLKKTSPMPTAVPPIAANQVRRNALGRGLSALLGDAKTDNLESNYGTPSGQPAETPAARVSRIEEIAITSVEKNPFQPRLHFEPEALRELSDSIKAQGIIQPITVRRLAEGQYQLISGERRLQASKLAGLDTIPAYIRTANDEQMLEMALIENIQRADLNPIEVALGYQRLMEEVGLNMDQVGVKVGKNRATVNNYLRLLKLPAEIQAGLRDQTIQMGHARALITVEDPTAQLELFRAAVAGAWSVRRVEEEVRARLQPKPATEAKEPAATPATASSPREIQLRQLQRELEAKFESRVRIVETAPGNGEIRISYYNDDDFNRILEQLQ